MAINYWAMFATLRMGLDILTETDWETVPHTRQIHTPVYTARTSEGVIVATGDAVQITDMVHNTLEALTLYEDDYPVFTSY